MAMSIAVIGAGVVGLSTAVNIIQQIPGVSVKIIADKFDNETTSSGAGGLFRPNAKHAPGTPAHRIKRWSEKSWNFYASLAQSDLSSVTGNCITSGYFFSQTKPEKAIYEDIVYSFRQMSDSELARMGMSHYKYGYAVTNIVTNMKRYLPWLMKKFRQNGGKVEKRKIRRLEELKDEYDIVVNCAALGNREMGDNKMYPVRGHLIRVAAPWIKHWVYTDDGAYFIPNADFVSLGGIRQRDNYSLEVDNNDTVGILDRCYKLWPALKGAEIIDEWIGLRPTRCPMKLEKEVIDCPTGKLKVVHNYGHGANGVTLSWGTAMEATELVQEMLNVPVQAKL